MRVPSDASPATQEAFREIWAAIDRIAGANPVDLHGRRISNAGRAVSPFDYVTKQDLDEASAPEDTAAVAGTGVFTILRLLGIDDASILFVDSAGRVQGSPYLQFKYSNNSVKLGNATKIRFQHGVYLQAPVSGVINLVGEDTDPLVAITFGPATNAYPALFFTGTTIKAKLADDSAYTEIKASKFTASAPATYTITNGTTDRSYDADATTLDEVADCLSTLVADLRALGLVL